MKQNNPPKNHAAGQLATTQNSVSDQIRTAKEKQKANARLRAAGAAGRKSMGAVSTTPEQSELTSKPPNLYQPERINVPADFPEVARLLYRELTKIAESQSIILTLWEKVRGQIADVDSVTFGVPVEFSAGATLNGFPIPTGRFVTTYPWDSVPWNADTGLYNERNSTETASDMIIHFYGGGSSCPAMQFRVDYKNGGLFYRSARDGYGFEVDFVELATQEALEAVKDEIYATLTAAGLTLPDRKR